MNYWIKTVSACGECHSVSCCCNKETQVSLRDVIRMDTSCPEEFRFPDADTNPESLKAFTEGYKAQLDAELANFGDRIINTNSVLRLVTSESRGRPKVAFWSRENLTEWIDEGGDFSRYIADQPQDASSRVAHVSAKVGVRIRDASTLDREANSWAHCPNPVLNGTEGPYALMAWCDMQLLALGYCF